MEDKLKLVIEGDASSATSALNATSSAMNTLDSSADKAGSSIHGMSKDAEAAQKELKQTATAADKAGDELKQSGSQAESLGSKLSNLANIGSFSSEIFSKMGQMISQSMENSAAAGDASSQAMLGQFMAIKESVDKLVAAFMKDLAPAIKPIAEAFMSLVGSLAEFVDKNDLGKEAVLLFVDVLQVFAAALQKAVSFVLDAVTIVVKEVAIMAQVLDQDLSDSLLKTMKNLEAAKAGFTGFADGITSSLERTSVSVATNTDKDVEQYQRRWEAANESSEKVVEAAKKEEEEIKISNESKLASLEEFWARDEEIRQEALDNKQSMEEEAIARWMEQVELESKTNEEVAARKLELDQMLADSETVSADIRIAAKLRLAERDREANERIREEARRTADEQIKKSQEAQQKVTASITTMASTMLNRQMSMKEKAGVIFDEMTKLVTDALMKQLTVLLTTTAQGTAAKSSAAAANIATSQAETVAEAATVPPKVASSFAGLGPLGPALAAVALSFFMGMLKTKIGLDSGGSPSGRVPGLGNADMVDAKLGADEFVIKGESARKVGADTLNFINQTGSVPGGSSGSSSGPLEVNLNITYSGIPQDASAFWAPIVPDLAKVLSDFVLRRGGTLTASGFKQARVRAV